MDDKLLRKNGESDKEYFERLMNLEADIIEQLELPPKKNGENQTEVSYFAKIVNAEKDKFHTDILVQINEAALQIPLNDLIKKNVDEDENEYFFRIISVEKMIRRNNIDELTGMIQEINNTIYDSKKLRSFVIKLLHTRYSSYFANSNICMDLLHSSYQELYANICRFNGRFDITTFAKAYLVKGATDFIKDNVSNMPSYYNEKYNKIRKVQAAMKAAGYSEQDVNSVVKIMEFDKDDELKGMSPATISATLKIKDATTFEPFDPDWQIGVGASGKLGNPEEELIKKERSEAFYSIYDSLKPYQRILLYAINGERSGVKESPESLGKDPEFIEALKQDGFNNIIRYDENGICYVKKEFVSNLFSQTMAEAKYNAEKTSLFSHRKKEEKDNYLRNHGMVIANKNYELLSDEDEDIIFRLDE